MPTAGRGSHDTRPRRRPAALRAAARVAALAVLATALAGCLIRQDREMVLSATEATVLAPEQAFVFPPPGGPAIVSVVQRRHVNALEQTITLGNASERPGENFIRITLFGRAPYPMADHATTPNAFPDRGDLYEEMDEAIPETGMEISPYFVRNKYGAFGYAMGRYSNDLCMYAWQRVGDTELPLEAAAPGPAISLRVRVCRTNATERQLLDLMYGLTITSYFTGEWAPFGNALRAMVPIDNYYPPQDVLEPPVRAPARAAATTATAAQQPAVVQPIVPTGPTVPAPPGAAAPATPGTGAPTGPVVPPPPG